MDKQYDYLVVGTGLFGAVFAREMAESGKRVYMVEKRSHIGGNVYTQRQDNIDVHVYGPHIFHTSNADIWNYINRFATFRPFINEPIANFKGKIFNLPFNMNTFSKMWNISTPQQAQEIIEQQRLHTTEPKNLEEQALSLVGYDIYQTLIKGYTEKQWGKPCSELPKEIIRRLPIRYTYNNNYFNDIWQGIPTEGYTQFVENILQHPNIEIQCNTDYLEQRESLSALAHTTLYTGNIDSYFSYRLGELEYRSLSFETEQMQIDNYQGNAVVNYTDEDTPFTRIIEHKYFNLQPGQNRTIVTKEYSILWDRDKEAFYPVRDGKNNLLYQQYQQLAEQEDNILFGGRLALYEYLDMDKVIERSLALAEQETNKHPSSF